MYKALFNEVRNINVNVVDQLVYTISCMFKLHIKSFERLIHLKQNDHMTVFI